MTEEIQYLDDELNELCQEIRGGIEDLNGNKRQTADKKSERIIHLTERINRAKQVYHSFKVELRELSRDELKEYEQKGKEHNNNITKLVNDLNWAKQNSEKSELMDGASKKKPGDDDFDGENSDVKEILAEGARIQDQSSASLQRSKKLVASAEQIGTETAVQLKSQTEQLKNIYANVEGIESNLKRADIIMKQFVKRMATDKLFMCFILLLVIAIIFIIGWKATHPDSGSPPSTR
mmetsp:Transcript_31453/g.73781  ORF Transcript_31453/g.73781 Transcript_31453/m.73781 type:complete len:236 (+) Transcript_31453:58-765(+)